MKTSTHVSSAFLIRYDDAMFWQSWDQRHILLAIIGAYFVLWIPQITLTRNDSCEVLATRGYWRSPIETVRWQPSSCALGEYDAIHFDQCFKQRSLKFIGDSIVRQIFQELALKMDPQFRVSDWGKHSEQFFLREKIGLNVTFDWDPFLQKKETLRTFQEWKQGGNDGLYFVGAGLHYLADSRNKFHDDKAFKSHMTKLFSDLPMYSNSSARLYFNPLLPSEQSMITQLRDARKTSLLEKFETPILEDTMDILPQPSLKGNPRYTVMWSFNEQMKDRKDLYIEDGIHTTREVAWSKANMLLNHFCNARLLQSGHTLPHGATCCRKDALLISPQRVLFFFLSFACILLIIFSFYGREAGQSAPIVPLATLAFACVAALICDRSDVWGRIEKLHDTNEFIGLAILCIIVPTATTLKASHKDTAVDKFLPIHQTEEWKGWMQAAILIYHWTGTSQTAWVYCVMRLLVASYLFMTGFGNTASYLKKQDFSFRRPLQQLLRLNLLALALSYTLNVSYLEYYFAPLVSVWVLIIYATMAIYPHLNESSSRFTFKILFSSTLVTLASFSGGVKYGIKIISLLLHTNWNAEQANFRFTLDLYVVYVGMILAYTLHRREESIVQNFGVGSFTHAAAMITSIAILISWTTSVNSMAKEQYIIIHPFVSPFAVLAFAVLRNSTRWLRKTYSTSMRWLGGCSLELFLLQFHLFLANDTKATLTLGLEIYLGQTRFFRYLQMLIIAALFIILSNILATATSILISHIIALLEKQATVSFEDGGEAGVPDLWNSDEKGLTQQQLRPVLFLIIPISSLVLLNWCLSAIILFTTNLIRWQDAGKDGFIMHHATYILVADRLQRKDKKIALMSAALQEH